MSLLGILLTAVILFIASLLVRNWLEKRADLKHKTDMLARWQTLGAVSEDMRHMRHKLEAVKKDLCGRYAKNLLCCDDFSFRRFYVLTDHDLILGSPSGYQTIHYSNIKRAGIIIGDKLSPNEYEYVVELWTDDIAQPIERIVFPQEGPARTFLARLYASAKM